MNILILIFRIDRKDNGAKIETGDINDLNKALIPLADYDLTVLVGLVRGRAGKLQEILDKLDLDIQDEMQDVLNFFSTNE